MCRYHESPRFQILDASFVVSGGNGTTQVQHAKIEITNLLKNERTDRQVELHKNKEIYLLC